MHFDCGGGALWLGDCLERMKTIPSGSVDMVLCDLPYGTTACAWDAIIPFEALWREYWRVVKPNAAIALTASQPFASTLIISQIAFYRYSWIWHKSNASGFVHARNKPMKKHEEICVFSRAFATHANQTDFRMPYNPQMAVSTPYKRKASKRNIGHGDRAQHENFVSVSNGERFPTSIIEFTNERGFHPTQKPVALFEYLIRTYTNPGDLVLDNCAGSGTTAIAAMRTGRRWLCIEKEPSYYLAACGRIWGEAQANQIARITSIDGGGG